MGNHAAKIYSYNLKLLGGVMTDNEIILESYKRTNKITLVMKETGFGYSKIKRILVENGLFESKGTGGAKRKNDFDDNYFDNIDTPDKAYWLGFLWGDGYIMSSLNTVGVSLKEEDAFHLEKFKKCIKYQGDIKIYNITSGYSCKKEDGTSNKFCRLLLNSKHMVKQLIDKGFQLNKSLIMKRPKDGVIPDVLLKHFLRGIFDANGSLCKSTNKTTLKHIWYIHVLGTEDIIDLFKSFYKHETYPKLYQRKLDCPIYDMRWVASKNNIDIIVSLYDDSSDINRLDRKYKLYKEILKEKM